MTIDTVTCQGKVIPGHQVASGGALNSPYPKGTIEMQTPHFLALGVDLRCFYPGTLNVSIAPYLFELNAPVTLPQVKWSAHHDSETFSFAAVELCWRQQSFRGLIYYPHPETKINLFQDPSVLELLLPKISGLAYGASVSLTASAQELIIEK